MNGRKAFLKVAKILFLVFERCSSNCETFWRFYPNSALGRGDRPYCCQLNNIFQAKPGCSKPFDFSNQTFNESLRQSQLVKTGVPTGGYNTGSMCQSNYLQNQSRLQLTWMGEDGSKFRFGQISMTSQNEDLLGDLNEKNFKRVQWPKCFFVKPSKARADTTQCFLH